MHVKKYKYLLKQQCFKYITKLLKLYEVFYIFHLLTDVYEAVEKIDILVGILRCIVVGVLLEFVFQVNVVS